jgi:hypothetical protein
MVVQRRAWVGARQVMPDEPGMTANMKALAGDNLVHIYLSNSEFADHAAGKTDYLGNLPASSTSPGTWVRFSPKGTNLLGENHEQITLEDVIPTVGSTSFIFEPFSTDALTPGSAMEKAYARDVADEVATLTSAKKVVPTPLKTLAKAFNATKGDLDTFIAGLSVQGFLGSALDTPDGKTKLPALARFTKAFIAAMLARLESDTHLTKAERSKMPKDMVWEQGDVFGEWRNLHFAHAVQNAVARGVRYAGMGRAHLVYLEDKSLPNNSYAWDMVDHRCRANRSGCRTTPDKGSRGAETIRRNDLSRSTLSGVSLHCRRD